jgi:hypothetical protein
MRQQLMLAAVAACALAADAGAQGAGGRGAPPVRRDTTWASTRTDRAFRTQLDSLRRAVLERSAWMGFAEGPCAPGDIRTFESDSANTSQQLLDRMELLVLAGGAYESVDTPVGRALMRAVVRLEAGGPGPRWDVLTGQGPRAFNPVLPASLYNPETKQCVMTPGAVPDGIVLPEMRTFIVPRDSGGPDVAVSFGPGGLNRLRDLMATRRRGDSSFVFRHTRVTAHSIWLDYAVVGVQRDAEMLGTMAVPRETTGAVYLFHRVAGEWRLLALVRNW